jgi:large-conductance mechanosensitive channel
MVKKAIKRPATVTNGSNIRFQNAKSSRSRNTKTRRVVAAQEISPLGNFVDFMKEYAVIGLIIGFVLGNQVQTLVKQIVQSFIDPLTQLLFGTELSQRTFVLHFNDRQASFGWGALVYNLIIFLLVILTMYIVLRVLQLDKVDKARKKG